MKYTIDQLKEMKEQQQIFFYKAEIERIIKQFVGKELSANILSLSEQQEAIKLHSIVISSINKAFYGLNIGEIKEKLRSLGIKIPDGNFIYILNCKHLLYYRSMLSKYYNYLQQAQYINHDDLIATAINIGERAFKYFSIVEGTIPIEDLQNALIGNLKKQQNNSPKIENKELKKATTLKDYYDNYQTSNDYKILKEKVNFKIQEIIIDLNNIPGIKSSYAIFKSLNNYILEKIYGKNFKILQETIRDKYNYEIKNIVDVMNSYHLKCYYSVLTSLDIYIKSKAGISYNKISDNLYEVSYSYSIGTLDQMKRELTQENNNKRITPYQDLTKLIRQKVKGK